MKRISILLLSALTLVTLLTACQKPDEAKTARDQQDLIQGMQTDGSMQPGAQVQSSTDEHGNAQVQYKNPDGSGGGGIAID